MGDDLLWSGCTARGAGIHSYDTECSGIQMAAEALVRAIHNLRRDLGILCVHESINSGKMDEFLQLASKEMLATKKDQ